MKLADTCVYARSSVEYVEAYEVEDLNGTPSTVQRI